MSEILPPQQSNFNPCSYETEEEETDLWLHRRSLLGSLAELGVVGRSAGTGIRMGYGRMDFILVEWIQFD